MRIDAKKIICLTLVSLLLISSNGLALKNTKNSTLDIEMIISRPNRNNEPKTLTSTPIVNDDLDKLVDLEVTVTIKEIRALDKIDLIGDPDFYVKIFINDVEWKSPVWRNQKYVNANISKTVNVPDTVENVNIKIQLWDWNPIIDKLCDISIDDEPGYANQHDIDLIYSMKTGHWRGDDFIDPRHFRSDFSGYGRANGCDDNSIYQRDRDCELLFGITQNDYDGDGIPYWTEVNAFHTDPEVDDRGRDDDGDGVPIEWEHKWGHYFQWEGHGDETNYSHRWIYDPFELEDHANLDPDEDGLQNVEEYLTSKWGSDPFRRDIFLELDQMKLGPKGEGSTLPELSKDMLRDAYSKHNIVFHIDDGCMGGGERIPFDERKLEREELRKLYQYYFLHNGTNKWRQGVFHYGLVIYKSTHGGFVFSGDRNYSDCFQITSNYHEQVAAKRGFLSLLINYRAIVYATAIMHETGHTLGIYNSNTPGCDSATLYSHIKYRRYKSCMNYFYMYKLVDYSDGSRGKNDFDDWDRIDLTLFQRKH